LSAEEKPAEEKPAEEKPAEERAEQKPAEEKPDEGKPAEQRAEQKPAEEKPAEEKAEQKPAGIPGAAGPGAAKGFAYSVGLWASIISVLAFAGITTFGQVQDRLLGRPSSEEKWDDLKWRYVAAANERCLSVLHSLPAYPAQVNTQWIANIIDHRISMQVSWKTTPWATYPVKSTYLHHLAAIDADFSHVTLEWRTLVSAINAGDKALYNRTREYLSEATAAFNDTAGDFGFSFNGCKYQWPVVLAWQ